MPYFALPHGFEPAMTKGKVLCALCALLLAFAVPADEAGMLAKISSDIHVGECVIFHEGGVGLLFKTPTYWLKGSVAGVSPERRLAGRCPEMGKLRPAYTRQDWVRFAAASPCVENDAEVREIDVLRIRVAVTAWETPWSNQHGTAGWLFRGHFLDRPLKKGEVIEMDAKWLERCKF